MDNKGFLKNPFIKKDPICKKKCMKYIFISIPLIVKNSKRFLKYLRVIKNLIGKIKLSCNILDPTVTHGTFV